MKISQLIVLAYHVYGTIAINRIPAIARIQCTLRYSNLDFDLTNYDAFPTYFRDDSAMVLANTGFYKGVEEIREYATFTSPDSPYLTDAFTVESETRIGGYDASTGQCIFDLVLIRQFVINPETANPEINAFDGYSMAKLFFDYEENYISRINLYFPPGMFLFVFRDVLESDNTRKYVCDLLAEPCAQYVETSISCQEDLAGLPAVESIEGESIVYVDGNSSGCKALHATFAKQSPELHCAHVSLSTDDLDPNGKNKCSVSALVTVESLFDEVDLEFFNDFAKKHGVDPEVGLVNPSPEFVEPGAVQVFFKTVSSLFDLFLGGFF